MRVLDSSTNEAFTNCSLSRLGHYKKSGEYTNLSFGMSLLPVEGDGFLGLRLANCDMADYPTVCLCYPCLDQAFWTQPSPWIIDTFDGITISGVNRYQRCCGLVEICVSAGANDYGLFGFGVTGHGQLLTLFDRDVVAKSVHVGTHYKPGYLVGLAILVKAGMHHLDDRDARREVQVADLFRCGHTCRDLIIDAGHHVTLFFKHPVDSVLVRDFFLEQPRPLRDAPGDPRSYSVDRVSVGVEYILATQYGLSLFGDMELLG